MIPIVNPELTTLPHYGKDITIDKKWRFWHETLAYRPKAKEVLSWKKEKRIKKPKRDGYTLLHQNPKHFFQSGKDGILRMGHASFFIRINGITFLTDPVYYKLPLVRMISKLPHVFDIIPHIDYLLLSHDHRDHIDVRTLKKLTKKQPNMQVLTGLNMEKVLKKFSFWEIQTAGWYQKYDTLPKLEVYFLPARHRCRRGLFDTNRRLWGSFLIRAGNKTIFFWGDSGYEAHFKEIWELFPHIDYALLGIGAYNPRWFMHPNHTSPEEALQWARDLWATTLIPMHYGVFDLSYEPPQEPIERLKAEAKKYPHSQIKTLQIREALLF